MKKSLFLWCFVLAITTVSFLSCDSTDPENGDTLESESDGEVSRDLTGTQVYHMGFEEVFIDGWDTSVGYPYRTQDWSSKGKYSIFFDVSSIPSPYFVRYMLPSGVIEPGNKISVDVRRSTPRTGYRARIRCVAINFDDSRKEKSYSSDWEAVYYSGNGRHLTYTIPTPKNDYRLGRLIYIDIKADGDAANDPYPQNIYIDEVIVEK